MNIKPLFFIVALLCGVAVFAQPTTATDTTVVGREDAKADPNNLAKAKFQINDIKSRGIIVRLRTDKDRIAAYRKEGYNKVADKLEESDRIANLRLMYGFIIGWTYCPVYFMESQHTMALMRHDSLITKTPDLLRDTVINVSRDSFYIADFGDLMATELVSGQVNHTQQSSNPSSGQAMVVKDHAQQQLQSPMPYADASIADMNKSVTIGSQEEIKTIFGGYSEYLQRTNNGEGPKRDSVNKYIDRIYDYLDMKKFSDKYYKTASRLNKKFITYYCKRLEKDRHIICNDDPIYWWHRNPNIKYLPAIPMLEQQLISPATKESQFTRQ